MKENVYAILNPRDQKKEVRIIVMLTNTMKEYNG